MEFFFETVDTILPDLGFQQFDIEHMIWLLTFGVFVIFNCKTYRRGNSRTRAKMRKMLALLIVGDELFKMICLYIGGNYTLDYLPLHLCSINIILIAIHSVKPTETLDNFLYMACIPGAIMALCFPTWASLPRGNFMYWHSFTVHIFLATYPLMLTYAGDIRPKGEAIPKSLLLLGFLAAGVYGFNTIFDTNFMFLMEAQAGTPLVWFEENMGNHLVGFPIMIGAVLYLMYVIVLRFFRKINPDDVVEFRIRR